MSLRTWKVDFNQGSPAHLAVLAKTSGDGDVDPPGYNHSALVAANKLGLEAKDGDRQDAGDHFLKEKKAWEFAQAAIKQIGMYGFMMYMSGNSVHIFSIMMTFNGIYQPFLAISKSGETFKKFSDSEGRVNTLGPRALYCLIQLSGLGFALYKLANVGLLPTHVSDWVSAMSTPTPVEYSASA
eukprot:CAMPEP_0197492466 /NCGR_PEP_ID=MMETSP1311-20131121/9390_1 /TAXON_ID=464262 /ORGANISM="Genus nov. species nov., Strain RCC856" /LENGTH=182 /DNA_ID=CAMNT_0043037377 /DNA_START=7 /DNA_END=555 /DNA_ORIENTATION=+